MNPIVFVLARGSRPHLVIRLQHLERARPHANIFGKVDPANQTGRIDQKFSGTRDIGAFRAAASMKEIVATNDFRLWIGQKRESVTKLLPVPAIDVRRIDANCHNSDTTSLKLRKVSLKTPQLGVA